MFSLTIIWSSHVRRCSLMKQKRSKKYVWPWTLPLFIVFPRLGESKQTDMRVTARGD